MVGISPHDPKAETIKNAHESALREKAENVDTIVCWCAAINALGAIIKIKMNPMGTRDLVAARS